VRFALLLLLSGCCTTQISMRDLSALRVTYDIAAANEDVVCAARADCDAVRTAHYNAAAALTEAADNGCKLGDAHKAVDAYVASEQP
jgi:hypothetical protein